MTNQEELLEEIFIKPANEIKSDRFTEQSEAASCSGVCSTGACRTSV